MGFVKAVGSVILSGSGTVNARTGGMGSCVIVKLRTVRVIHAVPTENPVKTSQIKATNVYVAKGSPVKTAK
jgi:hypothetical protein